MYISSIRQRPSDLGGSLTTLRLESPRVLAFLRARRRPPPRRCPSLGGHSAGTYYRSRSSCAYHRRSAPSAYPIIRDASGGGSAARRGAGDGRGRELIRFAARNSVAARVTRRECRATTPPTAACASRPPPSLLFTRLVAAVAVAVVMS